MPTDLLTIAKEKGLPMTGIPDEYLSSNEPPKAISTPTAPEEKLTTPVINTGDMYKERTEEEITRQNELTQQIADIQKQIADKQAVLAAVKAGEVKETGGGVGLDEGEKDYFGVEEPAENPEITALKGDIEQIDTDYNSFISQIDSLMASAAAATQAQITSIKATFDARRTAMKDAGMRRLKQLETLGYRLGTARYAPITATGITTAQEQATIARLGELDAQEQTAIAEAQTALENKRYQLLHDKIGLVDTVRERKVEALKELQEIANERNEEIQEENRRLKTQSTIISSINSGVSAPTDIFEILGGQIDLKEIIEIVDAILVEEQDLNESALTPYTDENDNRVQPFYNKETGEVREVTLRKMKSTNTPEDKAKLGDVRGLKNDFETGQEVKDFLQINSRFNILQEAQKEAATTDNFVAVDQAMITLFNKVTDPQSVVRESEYARTSTDIGIINRIKGKAEKILEGGAGLTQDERDAIERMAKRFRDVAAKNYQRKRREYEDIAKEYGINTSFVVGEDITTDYESTLPQRQIADAKAQLQTDEILVREKSSGLLGGILPDEFDETLYEKIE